MNVLVPLIDKVKYVHSLKEITVDIPHQVAVSSGELIFSETFGTEKLTMNATVTLVTRSPL